MTNHEKDSKQEKILEVRNLNVAFEGEVILHNVSFEVKRSDIVSIVGPNGAGKTTLFRALMDIIPYQGEVLWEVPRDKIGYAPQYPMFNRLFPLSVKEFFLLKTSENFFSPHKKTIQSVKESLALLQAESLLEKRIGEISTGQFQRVLVAWALFGNPDVLLFDEPTSGIDFIGQDSIYRFLTNVAKKNNLTILLISHDLNIIYRYATKVICLNKDIRCVGLPKDILVAEKLKEFYGEEEAFYAHKH